MKQQCLALLKGTIAGGKPTLSLLEYSGRFGLLKLSSPWTYFSYCLLFSDSS